MGLPGPEPTRRRRGRSRWLVGVAALAAASTAVDGLTGAPAWLQILVLASSAVSGVLVVEGRARSADRDTLDAAVRKQITSRGRLGSQVPTPS